MKKFFFIFLIFFSLFSFTSNSLVYFNETFGSTNYNYQTTGCNIMSASNDLLLTEDNYIQNGSTNISTTWDNTAYCLQESGTNYALFSQDPLDNLRYTQSQILCSGQNCEQGFYFPFSEDATFNDDHRISLTCGNITGGTDHSYLVFHKDDSTSFSIPLEYDAGSSVCSYIGNPSNCCDDNLIPNFWNCSNNFPSTFTTTFKNIKDTCNLNTTSFKKIKGISVEQIAASDIILDSLHLEFYNSTNSLPSYNFSIGNIECKNMTGLPKTYTVDLNISAYDIQGDTISYATQSNNENVFTIGEFSNDLVGKNCRVISFFGLFNITEICKEELPMLSLTLPNYDNFNDNCKLNNSIGNSFYIIDQWTIHDLSRPMLYHDPSCPNHLESYLDMKTDLGYLNNFIYSTEIYWWETDKSDFNITFYNKPQSPSIISLKTQFIQNTTHISVYNINTSTSSLLGVLPITGNKIGPNIYLNPSWEYNYSSNSYSFTLNSITQNNTYTSSSYDSTQKLTTHIGTKTSSLATNHLFIQSFIYGGTFLNYNWQTTVPTSIEVYDTDSVPITLYVSDEYGRIDNPPSINSETEYVTIPFCSDSSFNPDDTLNPLGLTKSILGTSMSDYLNTLGYWDLGKTVMHWAYLIVALLEIGALFLLTKRFVIGFPLLITSAIFSILAFLIGYTGNLITYLLVIGITLAGPVASAIIFGEGNG